MEKSSEVLINLFCVLLIVLCILIPGFCSNVLIADDDKSIFLTSLLGWSIHNYFTLSFLYRVDEEKKIQKIYNNLLALEDRIGKHLRKFIYVFKVFT